MSTQPNYRHIAVKYSEFITIYNVRNYFSEIAFNL